MQLLHESGNIFGCVLNWSDVFSQVDQHTIPESCTLSLLELLPSVECLSPRQALQLMKTGIGSELQHNEFSSLPPTIPLCPHPKFSFTYLPFLDPSKVVMDKQMFESSHYQRVYQYLQRHTKSVNLDQFSYGDNIEGTPDSCLETILL